MPLHEVRRQSGETNTLSQKVADVIREIASSVTMGRVNKVDAVAREKSLTSTLNTSACREIWQARFCLLQCLRNFAERSIRAGALNANRHAGQLLNKENSAAISVVPLQRKQIGSFL